MQGYATAAVHKRTSESKFVTETLIRLFILCTSFLILFGRQQFQYNPNGKYCQALFRLLYWGREEVFLWERKRGIGW